MKVLIISGSTRQGSLNTRLARVAAAALPTDTVTIDNELDRLPFFDADLEATGVPAPVAALREVVASADVLVIVTPEYNGTVPGLLGNCLDWLSRPPGQSVLKGKPVVVLSASPSRYGATRAAEHLRRVLGHIGADVAPIGSSVPRAHERLSADNPDPGLVAEVAQLLATVLSGRREPTSDNSGMAA